MVEIFRKLVNKSKLLTSNSDFTLQVSIIDGNHLVPRQTDDYLLIDNGVTEIREITNQLNFGSDELADTYFQFLIGKGLPKSATPLGVKILSCNIYISGYGNFFAPRSRIWDTIKPVLGTSKNEIGYWQPTNFFKLLSELQERKIYLEFPAVVEKETGKIFGAIPTFGNLIGHLRAKRVI